MHVNVPDYVINPDPDFYLSNNYIVLDWETTNLEYGDPVNEDNNIVCGVWKWGERSPDFSSELHSFDGGADGFRLLLDAIGEADFIVAHNAKFELQWLSRVYGREILRECRAFCTQVGEYTIRSNRHYGLSLEECLKRRGLDGKEKVVSLMMEQGICPSEMPYSWVSRYCKRDVVRAEQLFLDQREELWGKGLEKVTYTRMLQLPILADIEFNGMCLDYDRVKAKHEEVAAKLHDLDVQLNEMADGINWNSGPQVAEYVYEVLGFEELTDRRGNKIRTPKNKPKTDKETLMALTAKTKEQEAFMELYLQHQIVSNQMSKYLGKFKDCCEENKGILHASINQTRS